MKIDVARPLVELIEGRYHQCRQYCTGATLREYYTVLEQEDDFNLAKGVVEKLLRDQQAPPTAYELRHAINRANQTRRRSAPASDADKYRPSPEVTYPSARQAFQAYKDGYEQYYGDRGKPVPAFVREHLRRVESTLPAEGGRLRLSGLPVGSVLNFDRKAE